MADTINIFGKVYKAINEAMDAGDGRSFSFHDIERDEAMGISGIFLLAFLNLIRDFIERSREGTLSEEDMIFLNELTAALKGKNHGSHSKLFNYSEETKIIFVTLPFERIESLSSKVTHIHQYLNLIPDCPKQRVELPGHGNAICYAFHTPDITGTIGDRTYTESMTNFIGALLKAHGFEGVIATDLKQPMPMIAIKKTALDAVLRLEKLELQTQRDGTGEFPGH